MHNFQIKYQVISKYLIGALATVLTLLLVNTVSDAGQAVSAAPSLKTTFTITSADFGADSRFDVRTGNCLVEDPDTFVCQEWETVRDNWGPTPSGAVLRFVNKVSNMPSGWDYCQTATMEWQSFNSYVSLNLISIPKPLYEKMREFNILPRGGEGLYYDPDLGGYAETISVSYLPAQAKQVKYQGYALICGPDSSVPTGHSWKLVLGKEVTLPAVSKWR